MQLEIRLKSESSEVKFGVKSRLSGWMLLDQIFTSFSLHLSYNTHLLVPPLLDLEGHSSSCQLNGWPVCLVNYAQAKSMFIQKKKTENEENVEKRVQWWWWIKVDTWVWLAVISSNFFLYLSLVMLIHLIICDVN